MVPDTPVRAARQAAGLSQAQLAQRAGISRQAVGAIESGVHRPSVDAALAIATAVGRTVENLFAATPAVSVSIFGDEPRAGSPLLAGRVGDRVAYAPASSALGFEGWPVANAVLHNNDQVRPLPGADLDAFVLVGCDPALGLLAALTPPAGPRHVIALSGSTGTALDAMRDDRAHAALVHGRSDQLPRAPRGTLRLHLARWHVGVATRSSRPRSVEELCARRVRVVQRDDGASSQKAFIAAVHAVGEQPPAGPIATGHIDVARRVVHGATAGVTMGPAALGYQLAFTPLEEHVAEIWIDQRWTNHPGADTIGQVLHAAAFASRLALIGGYDLADSGSLQRQRS